MNNQQLSDKDIAIWQRLTDSYIKLLWAERGFTDPGINRVSLIVNALSGNDRVIALDMLQCLKPEERPQLLTEFVLLIGLSQDDVSIIHQAVLSLPRDWVLSNIEQIAGPLLDVRTDNEYRRLLDLYILLDQDMTFRLAQRAAQDSDPNIRKVGEDYLALLPGRLTRS